MTAVTGWRVRWQPSFRQVAVASDIRAASVSVRGKLPFRKTMAVRCDAPDDGVNQRLKGGRIGVLYDQGQAYRPLGQRPPDQRRRDADTVGGEAIGQTRSSGEKAALTNFDRSVQKICLAAVFISKRDI